ncbi:uroporphyrinogen-III C-methyltransferase [Pullulanibacillus sp. KACC 23026]|uniref:uroporphyrinogen-III C-methyltransferase n=1 Tax=Pullulanibacillus sp. KACC 23026 TaxID=3028315 RepID=UPI0023B16C2A|nr:uroporphyrinogen-III C-methyltransferase [Pullulanibacillus sp. KACC 23026]WEG12991.1 uroporphyrinogen-III C-methyltransferase [Pullulanibacillus sp. KACC 23026]
MLGKVYLVGAGPGDPDLITVKGLKCIQQADVIVYDRLVNQELLNEAKEQAELIYCGKLPNHHTLQQEAINRLLVSHAEKGKIVTRLKGGDPFIFGRGGEEAVKLAQYGIPFEIVPGVTSGSAAAAYAGIPLTHREYSGSVAFITGHEKAGEVDESKWKTLANGIDTLAIYMGVRELPKIVANLVKHGKAAATPIALIEWGTTSKQRTVTGTLETIVRQAAEAKIQNPTMIVIGEVVSLREQIQWFDSLLNKRVQEVL